MAATHRHVLALAGLLAEQCLEVLHACGGVSEKALRRFTVSADALFRAWTESLAPRIDPPTDDSANAASPRVLRPVFDAMATSGVLLRVACTLLGAIGRQKKIPAAADAAEATIRKLIDVARPAFRSLARNSQIPAAERDAIDQLAKRCDRLSDVLCGTMLLHTDGIAFVVDAERAADFAQTFARFPALVRVPVRQAAGWCSAAEGPFDSLTAELTQSFSACLAGSFQSRRTPPDPFTDLAEMFRPRILRLPTQQRAGSPTARVQSLAFPTFSLAKILERAATRS